MLEREIESVSEYGLIELEQKRLPREEFFAMKEEIKQAIDSKESEIDNFPQGKNLRLKTIVGTELLFAPVGIFLGVWSLWDTPHHAQITNIIFGALFGFVAIGSLGLIASACIHDFLIYRKKLSKAYKNLLGQKKNLEQELFDIKNEQIKALSTQDFQHELLIFINQYHAKLIELFGDELASSINLKQYHESLFQCFIKKDFVGAYDTVRDLHVCIQGMTYKWEQWALAKKEEQDYIENSKKYKETYQKALKDTRQTDFFSDSIKSRLSQQK